MKKFLSMAMALVMTLSLCAVIMAPEASASFDDIGDVSQYSKQAIEVIQAIQVMDGTTETEFSPEAGLTRRAAAKIICNMILGPTTAKALPTNANPFPDVPAGNQFAGYISYCAQQGIISGYGDGTFRPGDPLSGYAYLKMLLGALGYDARHEGFVGDNWKVNVAKIALGIGLNKGIVEDFDGSTQITREDAAIYAFNTIQGDMVEYESKNTIEINGVAVSMGGGNAKPQTWATSATQAGKINIEKDDTGVSGRDIVQFAERYFDKLERWPKQWDVWNHTDDLGRPATKWEWKGAEIGTYREDADLVYYSNVAANTIYNDLGMSSKTNAQVYFNGRYATTNLDGTLPATDVVEISKGNSKDINKNSNDVKNSVMADKIGDGTIVEVYYNDAENDVVICVMNVWAGKVASIKEATSSKRERLVLDVGHYAQNTVGIGDNRISKPLGIDASSDKKEYELPEGAEGQYQEDDVVAYIYAEQGSVNGANGIQEIVSVLSPIAGTLTRRYADKSVVLDGETYKYAKNVSFDFAAVAGKLDETNLSNKSEYIIYVDENDLVLWVEESEFVDDQYALIERIYLEDSAALNVLSATLGAATNKAPINNAHSAPAAFLRFTTGSRSEVNLNESAEYRLDDNTIKADYLPGQIVRYTINNNGEYKLKSAAGETVPYTGGTGVTNYAITENTLKGFTKGAQTVQADSSTKFVINDSGTYKTYTGIRNVPNISSVSFGIAYCKDNLAKVVYLTSGNVEGTSNDIIFLAAPSVSKRIDDDDFAPHFEYNAVVKNEITTLRVAYYTNAASTGTEADRLMLNGVQTGNDGKDKCILINDARYDGDNVLKSGNFLAGARGLTAYSAHGIKRVSGSIEDIKLDTARTELSKTLDEGVRVYYSNLDGEISEIDVDDIRTDGNDWVYYVQDGGDITYLFIQEVDEDAQVAKATVNATVTGYTLTPSATTVEAGQSFTFQIWNGTKYIETADGLTVNVHYTNTSDALTPVTPTESGTVWSVTIPSDLKDGTSISFTIA